MTFGQDSVQPMSEVEKQVSKRVGDDLVWLAQQAKKRGDWHLFHHTWAAVVMGNTQEETDLHDCSMMSTDCPSGSADLDRVLLSFRERVSE